MNTRVATDHYMIYKIQNLAMFEVFATLRQRLKYIKPGIREMEMKFVSRITVICKIQN